MIYPFVRNILIKLISYVLIFTGDTQEECLGCGKTFLAFSASINGRNFCRTCSKDTSTPNSSDFSKKFPSYTTDSGSEESYATEAEDNEEGQCEKWTNLSCSAAIFSKLPLPQNCISVKKSVAFLLSSISIQFCQRVNGNTHLWLFFFV